jgi:hypothetical protein
MRRNRCPVSPAFSSRWNAFITFSFLPQCGAIRRTPKLYAGESAAAIQDCLAAPTGEKFESSSMKKLFGLFVLALLVIGCKSNYDVTLTSGARYTGVSKPKLDKQGGMFTFKSASGRVFTVPETRVRTIEPHRAGKEAGYRNSADDGQFNSYAR